MVLAGAVALLTFAARPALGYVRYQVTDDKGVGTGVYFQWAQSCVPVTAYPDGFTDMSSDQVALAATSAAGAWSRGELACTFMDIQVSLSSDPPRPAGSDPYNVLVFKRQWCDPADLSQCEPSALAITSVWANPKTGAIHDGDIEVNADPAFAQWGDLAIEPADWKNDLQNALTHEMGHLIGLDHNCYSPVPNGAPMIDNQGQPVPDCADASPAVQAATMFNSARPGDLSKRTLSADDQQAVCDIYPVAADPQFCPAPPAPDQGGCACAAAGTGATPAGLAGLSLSLLLVALRGRRTRRRIGRRRA